MFRLQDRCSSLAGLIDLRAALRRQELLLRTALREVQSELRSWQAYRSERSAQGDPVPHDLAVLWDELAGRERELALDLLQVGVSLREANAGIQGRLLRRPAG